MRSHFTSIILCLGFLAPNFNCVAESNKNDQTITERLPASINTGEFSSQLRRKHHFKKANKQARHARKRHEGRQGPQGPTGPRGPEGQRFVPEVSSNKLTFTFNGGQQEGVIGTYTGVVVFPDQSVQTIEGTFNGVPAEIKVETPSQVGSYLIAFYLNPNISGTLAACPSITVTSSNGINSCHEFAIANAANIENIFAYINIPTPNTANATNADNATNATNADNATNATTKATPKATPKSAPKAAS